MLIGAAIAVFATYMAAGGWPAVAVAGALLALFGMFGLVQPTT